MKKNTILVISLMLLALLIASCGGKTVDRPDPILTPEQVQQQAIQQGTPVVPSGGAVASGVKHYTCPNNCAGSGGDGAGSCPVCGTAYVHNQAFHSQAGGINQTTTTLPQQNPSAEPPQNTAGVWHFTCSNGCAGGAGSAIACSTCGTNLVHNTAYHN